jgi:hypothetical protein
LRGASNKRTAGDRLLAVGDGGCCGCGSSVSRGAAAAAGAGATDGGGGDGGGSAGGRSGGSSGRDELLNVGVRRFELVFAKALGAPWPAGPQDLLKTPFTETARVIGRTAAHLLQTPAV